MKKSKPIKAWMVMQSQTNDILSPPFGTIKLAMMFKNGYKAITEVVEVEITVKEK